MCVRNKKLMAASALFRAKRGSFSNWNPSNKNLRLIHDVIDENDIESQHELAMLMLDGLVAQILHDCIQWKLTFCE